MKYSCTPTNHTCLRPRSAALGSRQPSQAPSLRPCQAPLLSPRQPRSLCAPPTSPSRPATRSTRPQAHPCLRPNSWSTRKNSSICCRPLAISRLPLAIVRRGRSQRPTEVVSAWMGVCPRLLSRLNKQLLVVSRMCGVRWTRSWSSASARGHRSTWRSPIVIIVRWARCWERGGTRWVRTRRIGFIGWRRSWSWSTLKPTLTGSGVIVWRSRKWPWEVGVLRRWREAVRRLTAKRDWWSRLMCRVTRDLEVGWFLLVIFSFED